METDIDEPLAHDVAIALQTYREFYEMTEVLRLNYARKLKKGIFNKELAIKGYANFVTLALKQRWFKKWYADITANSATRTAIAAELLEHYMEEIEKMSKA